MAIASRTFEIAEVVFIGYLPSRVFENLESIMGIERTGHETNQFQEVPNLATSRGQICWRE
jgi:hypothetical protein